MANCACNNIGLMGGAAKPPPPAPAARICVRYCWYRPELNKFVYGLGFKPGGVPESPPRPPDNGEFVLVSSFKAVGNRRLGLLSSSLRIKDVISKPLNGLDSSLVVGELDVGLESVSMSVRRWWLPTSGVVVGL